MRPEDKYSEFILNLMNRRAVENINVAVTMADRVEELEREVAELRLVAVQYDKLTYHLREIIDMVG